MYRSLLVGLAVIVAVTAVILLRSSAQLRVDYYKLTFAFSEASDLTPGCAVRYLGVQIGVVKKVLPVGQKVYTDVALDRKVRVPRGSAIRLGQPGTLLGSQTITIAPSESTFYYIPGDTVYGTFTETLPTLDKAVSIVSALVGASTVIQEQKIANTLDSVVEMLKKERGASIEGKGTFEIGRPK